MGSVPTPGPTCLSLANLVNCLAQMPAADNGASISSTKAVLSLLNSTKHLHLFSLRVSIDEILHVGALIQGYYQRPTSSNKPVIGAVIIINDADDGFAKITRLAAHITGEKPSDDPYTNSAISSFSRVVLVRGHKPPRLCNSANVYSQHLNSAAKNVLSTLTRLSQKFSVQRIIWHAHHDPTLLLHVLQLTNNPPIDAVTVFEALKLEPHAITLQHPAPDHPNALPKPWSRLMAATKKLHNNKGVPLVFLSSSSLRTDLHRYSVQQLVGMRDFFPTLLPESIWKPIIGTLLDQLLVGAMRLLAGGDLTSRSPYRSPAQVVAELKRRLPATTARGWANLCLSERSYAADAIRHTVRAALPAGNNPNAPLPTLAQLTHTIANPAPTSLATALNRLALIGPPSASTSAAASPSPSSTWAIRATLTPRTPPLPRNTPPGAITLSLAPHANTSNVFLLAAPSDRAPLQTQLGARWADHIATVAQRERHFPTTAATGGGFGVSKEVAEVWLRVVPGVVAGVVEEWGRWVKSGLRGGERERVGREVEGFVRVAREGGFTRVCEGVVRRG